MATLRFSETSWLLAHSFFPWSALSYPCSHEQISLLKNLSRNNLFSHFLSSFCSAIDFLHIIYPILVSLVFSPVLQICVLSIFSSASCAAKYFKSSFLCYCCKFSSKIVPSPPALFSPLTFYWATSHAKSRGVFRPLFKYCLHHAELSFTLTHLHCCSNSSSVFLLSQ